MRLKQNNVLLIYDIAVCIICWCKNITFMIRVFLFLLMLASFHGNAQQQYNVVFILVDDLGYGDLGSFYQDQKAGNKFDTPYLDVMASEGMVIKDHYTVPVCAPSRSSLLQGLSPGHSHVRNNQFDKALPFDMNMSQLFKMAGYKTFMVGKHGLAGSKGDNFPAHPLNNGFDDFFGFLDHLAGHEHYPQNGTTDRNSFLYEGYTKITSKTNKTYTTDVFTARAKKNVIDHVANNPNQPFFLYLSYDVPHSKLQIPTMAYPANKGVNGGLQWTGPSNTNTPYVNTATGTIDSWYYPEIASKNWPTYAKKHATMIRRLDEGIEDFMQTLKDLGIDENTLVVFTSDNGPHAEGGQSPNFFESYGEYRGIKRDLTDGGIRVPVIARWPNTIAQGSSSDHPCGMWNWGATFAEVAAMPIPARMDGASLLPILKGGTVENDLPPYIEYFFPTNDRREGQTIRLGNYIGVRKNIQSHADDFAIYDIVNDKKQNTNIAASQVELQQKMKDQVLRMRIANSTAVRPYDNVAIPSYNINGSSGLKYAYASGDYPYLPRVEQMTNKVEGNVNNFDLSIRNSDTSFAVTYEGFISVPTTGSYTFYMQSDAPAHLMIHDIHVAGSDMTHTNQEVSQNLNLEAGYHPIKVYYKHNQQSSYQLNLKYQGPNLSKRTIPDAALYNGTITTDPVNPDPTVEKIELFHKSSTRKLRADTSGLNIATVTASQTGDLSYWLKEDIGNGYFYLRHEKSGKKLQSTGSVLTTTSPQTVSNNVQWRWVNVDGEEWFRLEHRGSGNWLHVKPDGTTEMELIANIWTGDNTKWRPQLVDTVCVPDVTTRYRINGSWQTGQSDITVDVGTEVVISGYPENGTYTITDPQGVDHSADYTLGSVVLSDSGTYTIKNTQGCSATLNIIVQNVATCSDGIQNGDETGVDCGGSSCSPCPCTAGDLDGDGICDTDDLDDDNDGIKDTDECMPIMLNDSFSNGNGGGSHQFTQSGTEGVTIDLNTLDNSVDIKVNGSSIDKIFQLERYWYNSASEVFLKFSSGDYSSPWLANTNGLPRLRIVVDQAGNIGLFGTRYTNSTALEPLIRETTTPISSISYGTTTTFQIINPDISGADGMTGTIQMTAICDTDGDGILNYQDLDSDNDGCLDALEGGSTILHTQLVAASPNLSVGSGSTAQPKNLGTAVDSNGIPTVASGGQGIGSSQDAGSQQSDCTVPDTEQPSKVINLSTSEITYNSFKLNWSAASDNVGVTGYKVYRDSAMISQVSGMSTTLTGLNPSTTYEMKVTAIDAASNESDPSDALSVTTNAEPTCTNIKIVIVTDNYGYETAWTLKNSANQTVIQGGNYQSNNTYTVEQCLPQGCYTFNISDTYGDGICCGYGNGSYKIYSGGSLVVQGGNFQYSESKQVCNNSSQLVSETMVRTGESIHKVDGLSLYPNPSQSEIYLRAESGSTYSIINIHGQLLMDGEISNSPISVRDLNQGIYVVRVADKNGKIQSLNFIKE